MNKSYQSIIKPQQLSQISVNSHSDAYSSVGRNLSKQMGRCLCSCIAMNKSRYKQIMRQCGNIGNGRQIVKQDKLDSKKQVESTKQLKQAQLQVYNSQKLAERIQEKRKMIEFYKNQLIRRSDRHQLHKQLKLSKKQNTIKELKKLIQQQGNKNRKLLEQLKNPNQQSDDIDGCVSSMNISRSIVEQQNIQCINGNNQFQPIQRCQQYSNCRLLLQLQ